MEYKNIFQIFGTVSTSISELIMEIDSSKNITPLLEFRDNIHKVVSLAKRIKCLTDMIVY